MKGRFLLVIIFSMALIACDRSSAWGFKRGDFLQPKEAVVNLSDTTINKIDESNKDILLRYLASSDRWGVRKVYRQDKLRVIRREKRKNFFDRRCDPTDGHYVPTLNGFYLCKNDRSQSLAISFDRPYSEEGYTQAKVGEPSIQVVVEKRGPRLSNQGYSSNVVVQAKHLFLYLHERAPIPERKYTQRVFNDVSKEIKKVLLHQDSIKKTGLLPEDSPYFIPAATESSFVVSDEREDYTLEANLCLKEQGLVYVKVYDVETGISLVDTRDGEESIRHVGWSENKTLCYPYKSLVTVSGPKLHYKARFELWHRNKSGEEKKVAETVRNIKSWRR